MSFSGYAIILPAVLKSFESFHISSNEAEERKRKGEREREKEKEKEKKRKRRRNIFLLYFIS